MRGAVRRQYREYCQGLQRSSGAPGELPKGDSHAARGGVASLGNIPDIAGGTRLATNRVAIADATEQA